MMCLHGTISTCVYSSVPTLASTCRSVRMHYKLCQQLECTLHIMSADSDDIMPSFNKYKATLNTSIHTRTYMQG